MSGGLSAAHCEHGHYRGQNCLECNPPDKATLTNLGNMLRCFMAMERWSMRKLAPQIGISASTLHRVCSGYAMDADTLLKLVNWLMRSQSDAGSEHG